MESFSNFVPLVPTTQHAGLLKTETIIPKTTVHAPSPAGHVRITFRREFAATPENYKFGWREQRIGIHSVLEVRTKLPTTCWEL